MIARNIETEAQEHSLLSMTESPEARGQFCKPLTSGAMTILLRGHSPGVAEPPIVIHYPAAPSGTRVDVPSRHTIAANELASAGVDSLSRLRAAIAERAANGPGTPKHPPGEEGARKQTAERLQGSRTVASIAERLTHVGAWSVELPALRLTVSDEVRAIHGVPPAGTLTIEESISQYAPECRETITRAFGACVNSGTPFDVEVQLITPVGQRVWVRSVGEAVRDASGVIQRIDGAIQDISERMRAAAETRQLAKRLTATLESVTDAFFTLDRAWRFTFVNGAAERLLQRPRAELIGEDWRTEFAAAVDSAFGIEYRLAIADNHTVEFEEYYQPLNTWFSVRAYPSSEGLAVYFLDITEHKRMETTLRESEAEFRTLAEGMPLIVWVTNPAGAVVYANRRWSDYTGLSPEQGFGEGWNRLFHPEDKEGALDAWHHATATIGTYSIESRLRRADGVYRWWLIRGVPRRDDSGNLLKWVGTCTDIDDLKMAGLEISRINMKLRESDEKFQQLADNVTDVFWVASPDLQTVHFVSAAYEQVWGRSVESQYAHPSQWSDAIVPAERERVIKAFAGLAADKVVVSLDCQIQRPDASVRWIHMRVFRVEDAAGQLIRITGIASDITERKHSEEATERALQRLNDAQRIARIGDWGYDIASGAMTWSPEMFELLGRDPGTAKTTLSGRFAEAACERGERVLYVCFDESGAEIVRNLGSVGIEQGPHEQSGRLRIEGMVSRARSSDAVFADILSAIEENRPRAVVLDPLSALGKQGNDMNADDTAFRIVQECKLRGITLYLTSLLSEPDPVAGSTSLHVSTLADTWIHLSYLVRSGERNRAIAIVKSRGKGHSNQVRELVLSSAGITLENVYSEEGEVLMGTMRTQREAGAAEKRRHATQEVARERERMESTIEQLAARIGEQQIELKARRRELAMNARAAEDTSLRSLQERDNTSMLRLADEPKSNKKGK